MFHFVSKEGSRVTGKSAHTNITAFFFQNPCLGKKQHQCTAPTQRKCSQQISKKSVKVLVLSVFMRRVRASKLLAVPLNLCASHLYIMQECWHLFACGTRHNRNVAILMPNTGQVTRHMHSCCRYSSLRFSRSWTVSAREVVIWRRSSSRLTSCLLGNGGFQISFKIQLLATIFPTNSTKAGFTMLCLMITSMHCCMQAQS